MKIYVLNEEGINNLEVSYDEISDEEFKKTALNVKYGEAYTPEQFQEAFNDGDIDSVEMAIRIIEDE